MCPLIPSQPPTGRSTAARLPRRQRITARDRHRTIYAHSQSADGAVVRSNRRRTTFRVTSDPHGGRGRDRGAGRYTRLSILPALVPRVFEVLQVARPGGDGMGDVEVGVAAVDCCVRGRGAAV